MRQFQGEEIFSGKFIDYWRRGGDRSGEFYNFSSVVGVQMFCDVGVVGVKGGERGLLRVVMFKFEVLCYFFNQGGQQGIGDQLFLRGQEN